MAKIYPTMDYAAMTDTLAYGSQRLTLADCVLHRAPKSTLKIDAQLTMTGKVCQGLYAGGTWIYYLASGGRNLTGISVIDTSTSSLEVTRTDTVSGSMSTAIRGCANADYLFLTKNMGGSNPGVVSRYDPTDGTVVTYTGTEGNQRTSTALFEAGGKLYWWAHGTDGTGVMCISVIDVATMTLDAFYDHCGYTYPTLMVSDGTDMYSLPKLFIGTNTNGTSKINLADPTTVLPETSSPVPAWMPNTLFLHDGYLYIGGALGITRKVLCSTMAKEADDVASDLITYPLLTDFGIARSTTDGTSVWYYGTPDIVTQPISIAKCNFKEDLSGFDWIESMYLGGDSNAVWYFGI